MGNCLHSTEERPNDALLAQPVGLEKIFWRCAGVVVDPRGQAGL